MKTYFLAYKAPVAGGHVTGHAIAEYEDFARPVDVLNEMRASVKTHLDEKGTPATGKIEATQFNSVF